MLFEHNKCKTNGFIYVLCKENMQNKGVDVFFPKTMTCSTEGVLCV